jgi:hypothetical protein
VSADSRMMSDTDYTRALLKMEKVLAARYLHTEMTDEEFIAERGRIREMTLLWSSARSAMRDEREKNECKS